MAEIATVKKGENQSSLKGFTSTCKSDNQDVTKNYIFDNQILYFSQKYFQKYKNKNKQDMIICRFIDT